ncbi:MAG: hypothetical protein GEU73_09290 [Chloroflexi bacterium]|nr:hypothetical protein [Chloroflexota bacterium]
MKSRMHAFTYAIAATLAAAACMPGTGPPGGPAAGTPDQPSRQKSTVVGITNAVDTMPTMGSSTTSGGWQSLNELYAQGLVTSDRDIQRPVPRLAAKLPTLDDGSIEIQPDGRMRVVYPVRRDVTWHDGTPFTARDLAFAFDVNSDRNLPRVNVDAIGQMESVEATDDHTFVITFKGPYYQADSIGLRAFWPHPRHILEEPYRNRDAEAFTNLSFWTSPEYVHLGPFRLVEFRVGEELTFEAYDRYFLGQPKLDRIIVRVYNDDNVLFAAVKAGAVDMLMDNSLATELTLQLKDEWDRTGGGTVHVGTGTTRFIAPQFDPELQQNPAVLDLRVRQALMYALDRRAISEAVQFGHGELAANSLLPPGDLLFDAVKDGWARYAHDPGRARSILEQAGWRLGGDGILLGPGERPFSTTLWTTQGGLNEISIIADFWKQIGISADVFEVAGALVRNREYRQSYSGFETSARGSGDSILTRMDSRQSATGPAYAGSNRGHYVNPRFDDLIDRYRQTLDVQERGQVVRTISELMVEELPVMLLYFNPTHPAVRQGIKAFDDFIGGAEASRLAGTFSRNAHEWDLQ